ncbi:hypothetical protein I6J04_06755 [Staphylococcus carnosus]|uniref:Uncharacterized protein n=2 Tax=Staphylococcus carnosus TaxID=1281 RepID=A0AAJ0NIA3_STACA|nr:hypothetical protein [Staphylococcus carnosus]KKB25631.1 hypothetical protein VV61_05990 [Staphylococcus carnosus]QQS84145.1 hypothetical protein I6J04_06755 [Staphylococcus carnosus]QRQ04083.1 hypothetical protein I6J34_07150 [Staphylococcus carnosus]UTB99436.1 hypothetical protein A7E59_00875 [Staphylococcus carnosus]UTC03771.1 hypothetical protein A2I68_11910 [Staphylococcus carnosus]
MIKKNRVDDEELELLAHLNNIQADQQDKLSLRMKELEIEFDNLNEDALNTSEELDELIEIFEDMEKNLDDYEINFTEEDIEEAMTLNSDELEEINASITQYEQLDYVEFNDDWDEFLLNNKNYANDYWIDLHADPFKELLTEEELKEIEDIIDNQYGLKDLKLDKYDYMYASLSGILCGLIDVFIIGEPLKAKKRRFREIKGKNINNLQDSTLNQKVQQGFDSIVKKFADFIYEYDKKHGNLVKNKTKKFDSVSGAIGYLEERFSVNYDARYAKDLGLSSDDIKLNPLNHHLKSLAHQPDIIGLFFSLLDQFMDTTTVIDNGKIKIIKNPNGKFELKGKDFKSKIVCGFLNWLGHLFSDVAGSSGTRGHANKIGAGVPAPFYALTQLMTANVKDKNGVPVTFAKIAETVFKDGYDLRFATTLAIPVALNEIFIRIFWSIKEIFYHKRSVKDILKINRSREIDRLLLVGHGSLCMVDGIDAFARSGGGQNLVVMFSRMNIVGWARFGLAAFKETLNVYQYHSNLRKLDNDLEKEWNELLNNSRRIM